MEDQEFRHGCKLCDRSFPCGRSLGGHMRSHLINNNSTETDDQKLTRVKFSSLSNYTHESGFDSGSQGGYGLRENPKKTWRIAGSSEDTDDKLCRECGKEFQTWKALLSHMKCCHSNSNTNSFDQNEHDSGNISGNVVDSQSENETTNTRKRRTSGSRRKTRYSGTAATTTSSSNFSNVNNNASSSVTEIEQEQQEKVALCLMMLSRDVGHWGGLKYAAADDHDHSTSHNNSGFSDTDPSSLRTTRVGKVETLNSKKLKNKMLQGEISGGEFSKKNLVVKKFEVADQAQLGSNKFNSSKRKLQHVYDHSPKRGKVFECGTCNKVFRSYQALGGHRASHKKIKGCFASKTESSENTNVFDTDSKLSDSIDHHHHHHNAVKKVESSITKSKGHSCPICLKVFPTGQALGGHKRSHLIGAQSSIAIPKPENPEVRDFLDLNLPAPVEEEAFNTWWVGSSHKHEALVS